MKTSNQTRRILIWTVAVAVLAMAAFIWNASPPAIVIPPLPVPNGYDDFVTAGQQVSYLSWEDLKLGELKSALATNHLALTTARKGLAKKSQVPIGFADSYIQQSLKDIAGFKLVARVLVNDGRLAESEGRFNDAANDYAEAIALGIESARGGFLINGLVQVALVVWGVKTMTPIISKLNAESSMHALGIIEKAQADGDSYEQFEATEQLFRLHAPLFQRLEAIVLNLFARDGEAQVKARFKSKIQTSQRSVLILECQLAAHAFELQKGRPATNWNDLVPAYLPTIPDDPTTTNQPMKFTDL